MWTPLGNCKPGVRTMAPPLTSRNLMMLEVKEIYGGTTDVGSGMERGHLSNRTKLCLGSRKSMLYNGGGNFVELLEDMDTSESEHSDCEVDDDWKYSSLDVGDESGWAHAEAKGRRRKTKRKMSKPGRHSVAQSNSNYFF